MAADYPSSLPVKDAAGANLSSNPHSALHDDMYDEIVAIATELGTNPKGTAASVKARINALPRGVVARAAVIANQTGLSNTVVDITGLTATWTAEASRLYRISYRYTITYASGSAATVSGRITDGSNNVNTIMESNANVSTSVQNFVCQDSLTQTGLSGSITRKVRNVMGSATSYTMSASALNPAYILVEDLGLA